MSGGFFRGTSADQDTRFSNKQAKLLKTQKFAAELEQLVDMTKVKMDVIRPWIAARVTELLGFEDEVLINFIYGLLDGKEVNGKEVQIQLTGFMEKNTGKFMKELWTLLLSAQKNASGVPQQLLDAKEEEIKKKKAETDFLANEIQKKREKENRDVEEQRSKKMDDGATAALDSTSKNMWSRAVRNHPEDGEETEKRNAVRGRSRVFRSPHLASHSPSSPRGSPSRSLSQPFSNSRSYSNDTHKSRSMSRSPERQGRSFSRGRLSHSPPRLPMSPRRRDLHDSFSPQHRLSYSRRRSRSTSHRKSLSPTQCQQRSPSQHSSPSPHRNSHRSPSPVRYSRSPSPVRRRRPPSPVRRRRPLSPMRRRRSPSPVRRRRSPSPGWRRRPPSLVRHRRSPSPLRRRRSPSPIRRRRSPSLARRRRSPSPTRRRRSPSPKRRRRSSSLACRHRSPSPSHRCRSPSPTHHRRSPSPVRRHRSRSPIQRRMSPSSSPIRRFDRSSSLVHRRTPSPVQHRSPLPTKHRKSPSTPLSKSPLMPQRLSPTHHRRSLTPTQRRSLSPYDPSSSSVERGTPSPVKRKSAQHQRRPPIQSPRDRTRHVQTSPPISHRHSRSMRSPQKDAREWNNSNNRIHASSSSLEKSPALTESPPVTKSVSDDRRVSSPRTRAKQQHHGNHLTTKGEEETTYAREGGNLEPRASMKRSLNSSIVGKMKDSPVDVGHQVSSPESEKHSQRGVPGTPDRQKSSSRKEHLLVEEQQPSNSREGIKHDEKSLSHLDKVKESGFHKSDAVAVTVEKLDHNSLGGSLDSDLEEGYKRKTGSKEKKRYRRSGRQETTSDSDDSYDTELERKEARRRKKEEKKLRKEKKRQRREERRRKKEERRAEKTKAKNLSDAYSDDGRVAKEEAYPSDADESEHRKLEIELRKKALESFNARKGMRH